MSILDLYLDGGMERLRAAHPEKSTAEIVSAMETELQTIQDAINQLNAEIEKAEGKKPKTYIGGPKRRFGLRGLPE